MKAITEILNALEEKKLYPDIQRVSSFPMPEIIINGRKILSFCSNNYLGLASHPKVIEASVEGVRKYGTGAGGSRMLSGNLEIHEQLERIVADFEGTEAAIVYSAGYMANLGTISAIMDLIDIGAPARLGKGGTIFSDELNHASIIDGCRFSQSQVVVYKHIDMDDLEYKLRKHRNNRKMIVTDGVFSMDGDIAPLPKVVELARIYDAIVMVDEAHATGVMGRTGRGTIEHFGVEGEVDLIMGTFSKALGAVGGYIAGSEELVKFLKISSRSYIFSAGMPPGVASGVIAAINEIKDNPSLRERLWENAELLRTGLQDIGFDTLKSETQIIPVLIGNETKAIEVANLLLEDGFFAPCVRWPAVPKNMARIRFTVMAPHTETQIKALLRELEKIGKMGGLT